MKTRCPVCQTTFRVTPEQLKVRAGNVRCGQCHAVFNALDGLLDEVGPSAPSSQQPESTETFFDDAFLSQDTPDN
ncbi:MAG TPA: zinc-ribbon domain-containing protein, partial [Candidatus Propionivibrio aalborgensis]|nr:zinc-ribbon domain-containing protein [Candidatus Propionivibrio aalborgensis]